MMNSPYLYDFYTSFKIKLNAGRGDPVIIYEENLDLSRFHSLEYQHRLDAWLKEKYKNIKIDAVVVIGQTVLNYFLERQKSLWPETPILFTLASDSEIKKISLPDNVGGKTLKAGFSDIVKLAKTLLPETTHIAIIGNTPAHDVYRTDLPDEIARLAAQVDIIDLRGLGLEELQQRTRSLPKNTVVYFTMLTIDGSLRNVSNSDALQAILKSSNTPVLVDNPSLIGSGTLGAISFEASIQGQETAELLNKVLAGEKISSLSVSKSSFISLLDWRELKHWSIQKKNYPKDSELRFYAPNVWELYRTQIIVTLGVIIVLLCLLGALLVERKRRTVAVAQSRHRLAQIAFMNRQLTATVYSEAIAHELIQPLAAILSNTEAAQVFLTHTPPQLDMIQEILENIKRDDLRAGDLINSMRGLLTKSESKNKSVNINTMVQKVLKFLSGEAKMRQVQLIEELALTTLIVSADPVQLQQVMVNLILNALDAIDEADGVRRSISVFTTLDETNARVSVVDTGIGFDENIERVFDSFFTTKTKGMGLGLTITEAIVQAHGGKIWAENGVDGAVVHFSLPLQLIEPDE
ncbi:ABC transporter substrate binding protein [Undibacterium sp. Ren11W]|uniref:ABC transporter substrate binding protein n=1 Tax=Undibacterium sp. Ren11W TaxID=3413045 RepID=UPI003BF4DE56